MLDAILLQLLTNSSTTSNYHNHTMSAVTNQSLSTALTVISVNIEGLTAVSLRVSPRNTPIHQSSKAKDSWNVASSPHNKYGILIRNDLKVK